MKVFYVKFFDDELKIIDSGFYCQNCMFNLKNILEIKEQSEADCEGCYTFEIIDYQIMKE